MKKIKIILAIGIFTLVGMSLTNGDGSKWVAPKSASTVKNPFKTSASATAEGKKLYSQMCAVCHGAKGKGDGVAGMSLTPKPANFTKELIQTQTDGAIYWKLTTGRTPMAGYEKSLTDKQRWGLVNYIRTFKKVSKKK